MIEDFKKRYGPWAVVTGASDGIGRAVAVELARRGLDLVLVARRREVLEDVARSIEREFGVQTKIVDADLGRPEGNETIRRDTESLDVGLVAAIAGFGTSGEFLENSIAQESNMLAVNCTAVLEQVHHFGNRLKARGRGGVMLMGSLLGFQGTPGSANYAATKAYVQSLAEGLHFEMKPHGIDVLAVAPGPVATGFGKRAKMKLAQAQNADVVAKAAVRALGRQVTVRPGWLAKALEASLTPAPRSLRVRIMDRAMRGVVSK